jgi:hypothetical protein
MEGIQTGSPWCIQRSVKRGEVRTCDLCEEIIPRGTPFRSGWPTPAAVIDGDAASQPTFDIKSEELLATTTDNVDAVH